MNELSPRFWKIFFEVYEKLPRQGPGNRTCAAKALDLCSELRESPAILDLGCGVGAQTFYLTELTTGSIEAVDNHAPFIELLQVAAAERELSHRIRARVGDMANLKYQPGSFDLIGHFTLPDEAWWEDFYTPMEIHIRELRDKYGNDAEASAILDQFAAEPDMHRRYSDFYAYEFFVARRPCPNIS